MTANSMEELEKQIMDKMRTAMLVVRTKAEMAEKEELQSFYSTGNPSIYVRTGKLGNSDRISGLSGGGKRLSFDAWLDQSYGYDMPNEAFTSRGLPSYFSTPEVLIAAENGSSGVLGRPGFWQRTEKRIESDLNSTFASSFR